MNTVRKLIVLFPLICGFFVHAQDVNLLLKEASNFEKQLKEIEALEKYREIAAIDTGNIFVLVKCTELNCSIGGRQTDKNSKVKNYTDAKAYAQKASGIDPANADANYAMALSIGKMSEIETDKKQLAEDLRETKMYADKAVALNPNHAKANYVVGKWHFSMLTLSWLKRATEGTLHGGLPKADIDSAIFYMEKCRKLDQYFVRNYLDLAKAYAYKNQPSPEMDVLKILVKLPVRTPDDAALKEEGKKMLDQML